MPKLMNYDKIVSEGKGEKMTVEQAKNIYLDECDKYQKEEGQFVSRGVFKVEGNTRQIMFALIPPQITEKISGKGYCFWAGTKSLATGEINDRIWAIQVFPDGKTDEESRPRRKADVLAMYDIDWDAGIATPKPSLLAEIKSCPDSP